MRKTKREKIIKKLIDEEFGPNLSADELCSEIDFTQRKGIKIVQEEKKPFFKRPVFMCLANVCLILVCILSTFLITKNNNENFQHDINYILESEEIEFLKENNQKYSRTINHILFFDNDVMGFILLTYDNNEINVYMKFILQNKKQRDIYIYHNDEIIKFDCINDFQRVGKLDSMNNICFTIECGEIRNEYSLQFNK